MSSTLLTMACRTMRVYLADELKAVPQPSRSVRVDSTNFD
jgi:hypothetical protein